MSITFAGIDVTPPLYALQAVERYWHNHRIEEFTHPAYLTAGIDHLSLPYPPHREPPRIGVLSWPTGASRWATCHLLVTGTQLASIQRVAGSSLPLVMFDGTIPITAAMYRLAARPVSQRGDSHELYLLTLVDDRYYWWMAGDQSAPASPASWSGLLTSLFTSIGVTPSIDTISANYGTPSASRWNVGYKPLPLLIDAVCRAVGLRCTRSLSGSVSCVLYSTAKASDASQWTNIQNQVLAGGRAATSEVGQMVPASCAVVFLGDLPSVTTNTLTGLAITDYGSSSGVSGKTGQVVADIPASAPAASLTNYATQAAKDFYLWQLSLTDATLRGIQVLTSTGLEDRLEWVHDASAIVTRVLRARLFDANTYGDIGSPNTGANCVGCGWIAGLLGDGTDCLVVSVNGASTGVVLQTLDSGATYTSGDQTITICGTTYTVRFTPSDPAKLVLFAVGGSGSGSGSGSPSYTGRFDCCGCNYAVWAFSEHTLCPSDTLSPNGACYRTVKVRVDWQECATTVVACQGIAFPLSMCLTTALTSGSCGPPLVGNFVLHFAGSVTDGATGAQYYRWCSGTFDLTSDQWALYVSKNSPCNIFIQEVFNVSTGLPFNCSDVAIVNGNPSPSPPYAAGCSNAALTVASTSPLLLTGAGTCAGCALTYSISPYAGSTCACTPLAGWDGPAYYCVANAGASCTTAVPLFLTDSRKCDSTIQICSGPYATQAAAAAACSGGGGGCDVSVCCPGVTTRNSGSVAWSGATGGCVNFVNGAMSCFGLGAGQSEWTRNAVIPGTSWQIQLLCFGGWLSSLVDISGASTPSQIKGTLISVNCNSAGNVVVVFSFTFTGVPCNGTVTATFTLGP